MKNYFLRRVTLVHQTDQFFSLYKNARKVAKVTKFRFWVPSVYFWHSKLHVYLLLAPLWLLRDIFCRLTVSEVRALEEQVLLLGKKSTKNLFIRHCKHVRTTIALSQTQLCTVVSNYIVAGDRVTQKSFVNKKGKLLLRDKVTTSIFDLCNTRGRIFGYF